MPVKLLDPELKPRILPGLQQLFTEALPRYCFSSDFFLL